MTSLAEAGYVYIVSNSLVAGDKLNSAAQFESPYHSGVANGTVIYIVTYSGVLFTMELYCSPKSQYTTVKHSQKLFEQTYTSDLYGLGTLTPIEFFQQDLLWQSSNTNSHSCSQEVSKHTSGQSIVGLSVHLLTTTAPQRIVHH
jgi:hypothetical protein